MIDFLVDLGGLGVLVSMTQNTRSRYEVYRGLCATVTVVSLQQLILNDAKAGASSASFNLLRQHFQDQIDRSSSQYTLAACFSAWKAVDLKAFRR